MPPPRPKLVLRPRLIERLNEGLHCKLTLISAPAGFGKTTLVSEWIANCRRPAAWLSLDEGDNDPTRFLAYVIAALQTVAENIGEGVLHLLHSSQPPPPESLLTTLLNDIVLIPDSFIFVLDDYHAVDAKAIDQALSFLLEHLPPQMHLVIATREDPQLPLARLRARGQLNELRAVDLRFTPAEAAGFLNQVMGLTLTAEDIAALDTRTEGWIAGLQLAAISMRGHKDASTFIKSFTGSHHFVLDYLVEEVLHQQPVGVQTFLLRTSILNRMCGPLCDAVLLDAADVGQGGSGQETLEYLEHANLFVIPLDNERRWYRYHHLFADLLRQRLHQSMAAAAEGGVGSVAKFHIRASIWYEENGLDIEAFHHAAAANDVARAERLIEGKGMPLHFRGALAPILTWLDSLPTTTLDAMPSLWTTYASVRLATGQPSGVEEKLQAAEAALKDAEPDAKTLDIFGRIAAIRATLAASQRQVETIITQSRLALEYLHPDNLSFRTFTIWKLGYAYHLRGERAAARQAYTDAIAASQASENTITTILATIGLGSLQEADNQLFQAMQTNQRALQLIDTLPLPVASEAHLGVARISYEWNDLETAQRSVQLARKIQNNDRVVSCEVMLARFKLAQGDVEGADEHLAQAEQLARQHNFMHRMAEVAATQVLTRLHQGKLAAAAHLAQMHELPISQARVHLAQADTTAALATLTQHRQLIEAKGWADECLKTLAMLAIAHQASGDDGKAVQLLGDALALAETGGFIRTFVDEGLPMVQLLHKALAHGVKPEYISRLLAAFADAESEQSTSAPATTPSLLSSLESTLVEPLSEREIEVLQVIAEGLSNQEVASRLYLSLHTVKVHARNIFAKLGVKNRTQAVAKGRELRILSQL